MGSERPELESGRLDIGSDMPILRSEKSDLGSERSDLRVGIWAEAVRSKKIKS